MEYLKKEIGLDVRRFIEDTNMRYLIVRKLMDGLYDNSFLICYRNIVCRVDGLGFVNVNTTFNFCQLNLATIRHSFYDADLSSLKRLEVTNRILEEL